MQAKQTGAHCLELEDGVYRLMVKTFFRSFQPCWHELHADSANPSLIGLPSPMLVPMFGMGMAVNSTLSCQSQRLYIGSITIKQNLADFFNKKITEMKIGTGVPGIAVLAV
jgi:hypothetical protein